MRARREGDVTPDDPTRDTPHDGPSQPDSPPGPTAAS